MSEISVIDADWLASHPLPQPVSGGDKEVRGCVLIAGGSAQTPGAVMLAGEAAMRAGAGKLQIATVAEIAQSLAVVIPEARVMGCLFPSNQDELRRLADSSAVVALGPGMMDKGLTQAMLAAVIDSSTILVVDAMALFADDLARLRQRARPTVLTPNPSEAATMLNVSQDEIESHQLRSARAIVERTGAIVALKGRDTIILAPDGRCAQNRGGNAGLATSGSGDVLAGIITGLLARDGDPFEATAWGVHLHARAGDRLAERSGPIGYLARDLSPEVPSLMRNLALIC